MCSSDLSKYPIPPNYRPYTLGTGDVDLYRVLSWFSGYHRSPSAITLLSHAQGSTPARSMWMSNLEVDIAWADPDHIVCTHLSRTNDITALGHASDANAILSWHIFLGGCVQEETLWADDKSYVVTLPLLLST